MPCAKLTNRAGPLLPSGDPDRRSRLGLAVSGGAALGSLLELLPVALWGAALVLLLRLQSA
ncbi:MAG: hypothetical protein V5A91_02755 [Candidatus Accumulibacter necessarius]|jgi:hypothetical protein